MKAKDSANRYLEAKKHYFPLYSLYFKAAQGPDKDG